jgi:hypothetical protein
MKTRNMILSGVIALFLVAAITQIVYAGEYGVTGGPIPSDNEVFLIKKTFTICGKSDGTISGNDELPGGSVPPSGQQFGCVNYLGDRFNEYLFSGERMAMLVAVRNVNGAEDIVKADLMVDSDAVVKCTEITGDVKDTNTALGKLAAGSETCSNEAYCWYGHDVSNDLAEQPPAKTAGTPTGFNSSFDKLYQCILTATPGMTGEKTVTVAAYDQAGTAGVSVPDQVWFNPEILIDVFTSDAMPVWFADGTAGQTVYSMNTLKIKNDDVDGAGVDVIAWLAGTDLVSSAPGALCPNSNVLESKNIDYRCKIGTIFNNDWTKLQNPDDRKDCDIWNCQGATPLQPDVMQDNNNLPSIIAAGHTAECWFRLNYPVPCIGMFDMGQILVYARAI